MKKNLCRSIYRNGLAPVLWVFLIAFLSLGAVNVSAQATQVYKGLDNLIRRQMFGKDLVVSRTARPESSGHRIASLNPTQIRSKSVLSDTVNSKWRAYLAVARST
jgi:hypothetical protein